MSLLFNMVSRFVIACLLRSKCLLVSWLQSLPTVILEPKKIKCHCFHFPPHLFAMKQWDQMPILVFWMLNFKPAFSLSSFTFNKRLFNSFLLSAIRVASSAYLRFLTFFQAILIPACDSSSATFHVMSSACKLNKQGDIIQPWCTPFPIWNQFVFHVWF